jgi:glycine dehydrogenase subunit 1
MPFIAHTASDVDAMLASIGAKSIEDLFDEIPRELLGSGLAGVPPGVSEMEVMRVMTERAEADGRYLNFIGAGAYEHHIPAAVWQIATRGEFYSAYTPYQAEASQGTLQVMYEYQSMMASLTAMDVSNASLYDGASALAEAILMAVRAHKSARKVLLPATAHPHYRKVAEAIVSNQGIEFANAIYCAECGNVLPESLTKHENEPLAALVIQQPNFFGVLEETDALTDWAHRHGALVIAVVNPISLALLKPPGEWGQRGADIVVGEGQPLGAPLAGGGPYFGFMCCKKELVRQMPGRLVGRTVDADGKPGFTLTLQAREQHIRRAKATSNICTNQGLAVTAATIHMALLGPAGLRQVALASHANTERLKEKLAAVRGVSKIFSGPTFHEFAFDVNKPAHEVLQALRAHRILGGIDLQPYFPELGNAILACATETKTCADIDAYVQALAAILE